MADGVLLDTSFLISWVNPARPNHETARRYFDYFVHDSVLMHLSTIVAAEFHLKQPIGDLPLEAFIVQPFGLRAAMAAAELEQQRVPEAKRDPATSHAALKDDMKLLGQAKAAGIGYVITDDERSLFKWCERLHREGHLGARAIKLSDGFDRSHFDPAKQHHLDLDAPPPADAGDASSQD